MTATLDTKAAPNAPEAAATTVAPTRRSFLKWSGIAAGATTLVASTTNLGMPTTAQAAIQNAPAQGLIQLTRQAAARVELDTGKVERQRCGKGHGKLALSNSL